MDEQQVIKEYFARIGRKGGASGKGKQWRRAICKHAANVRWRTYRIKKRKEQERKEAREAEKQKLREEFTVHPEPVVVAAVETPPPSPPPDPEPQPPPPPQAEPLDSPIAGVPRTLLA